MRPVHVRRPEPFPSRIWQTCAESPFEIPIALYLGLIGLGGILSGHGITPKTIDATLPVWLIMAWTVGLAFGGISTCVGKLMLRPRIESSGLALLLYGSALYGVVLAVAGDWPVTATAVAAMLAITAGCGIRLRVLALAQRARGVASELGDGQD